LPGEGGNFWGSAISHVHGLKGSLFAEVIAIAPWEPTCRQLEDGHLAERGSR
jgi:hypothetical protein